MGRHLKRRHVFGVAMALVAALALSGVAFAYWTATGGGTGNANAAAGVDDVTVTANPLTAMYPGDSQGLTGLFTNGNTIGVYITSMTVSIDSITSVGTCTFGTAGSDFQILNPTVNVAGVLPVGTTAWAGPTIVFNDQDYNQDGCKGATVNLTFTITP